MTTARGVEPRHRAPDDRDESAEPVGAARRGRSRGRSVRALLLLILLVPTGALMVVAGVGVARQVQTYRQADTTVSSVRLVLVTQGLVHELQRERGLTNGLLGGQAEYAAEVAVQRTRADTARSALDVALQDAPAGASARVVSGLQRLADLGDVRSAVDRRSADRSATLEFYTTAIVAIADASSTGTSVVPDPALRANLEALRTLGQAKEATALERGFLNGIFSADAFRDREYVRFAEIRAARLAGLTAFAGQATGQQQAALDAALGSSDAAIARGLEQRAIDGPTAPSLSVSETQWWDVMTVLVDDMRAVQQQVGADAEARVADLRAEALRLLLLNIGLALAALGVAVGLAVIAARSITRPLRLVASEAARLPETVARIQATDGGASAEVPSAPAAVRDLDRRNDEIGEVSQALTQVQQTAVRLASEQAQLRHNTAESLSSLARRNQNLLRRLLGLVTRLERDEEDPAALANLFELDHLATRMRRNAESLLILVGERSPRQPSRPVSVSDVVRAALSEVEEYRRVALHRLEDALIVGTAGAELAHLVAELVENGLSFSPPDRDVEVYGQHTGAGYVLAVLDHGIGMSPEDLAQANRRLAGDEMFDVAPTRYLGHYVVGQLARRLDVDVRLHESPLTGVTARLILPPSLLTSAPAVEAISVAVPPPAQESSLFSSPRPFRLDQGSRNPTSVALLEAAPPPPRPAPDEPGPAASGRTRNGLVKRVRNGQGEPTPIPRSRPAPDDEPVTPRRAPAEVRTSLNGFRAGFERHEQERTRTAEQPRIEEESGERP